MRLNPGGSGIIFLGHDSVGSTAEGPAQDRQGPPQLACDLPFCRSGTGAAWSAVHRRTLRPLSHLLREPEDLGEPEVWSTAGGVFRDLQMVLSRLCILVCVVRRPEP